MPTDPRLKKLEDYWKRAKWRKVVNFFYVDLNEETMAHFVPLYRGTILRIQAGVTNRVLNRVAWDISGIPKEFGTLKEQLTSANKCMLGVAHGELEFDENRVGVETAQQIIDFSLENARQFDSVPKIREKIAQTSLATRKTFLSELVCAELWLGNRAAAHRLLEEAKQEDPLFETTFLGKAERFLARSANHAA